MKVYGFYCNFMHNKYIITLNETRKEINNIADLNRYIIRFMHIRQKDYLV